MNEVKIERAAHPDRIKRGEYQYTSPILGYQRRAFMVKCYGQPDEKVSDDFWVWKFLVDGTKRIMLTYDSSDFVRNHAGYAEVRWTGEDFSEDEFGNLMDTIERVLGQDTELAKLELKPSRR